MRKRLLFGRPILFARLTSLALVGCAAALTATTAFGQTQPARQTQASGAQTQGPRHILPPGMRTLSAREGRVLVRNMAWADDEEGLAPDCSHLVHALYEQAGYSYPYASSVDLYHGEAQRAHFVRMRYPQPGDLIVWPGHVGIVVDPVEHSFFSTTSSGVRTQNYASPYWRARGRARFYRYITSNPKSREETLMAANRPPERPPQRSQEQSPDNAPKVKGNPRVAADQPALQPVKTSPVADKPRNKTAQSDPTPASTVPGDNSLQIALRSGGKRPKAADVSAALAETNLGAGEILRASDLEQLEQPVVVYRDLQVGSVELKGKHGAAQIKIETIAMLSADRMESQQGWEEQKLELQRAKSGWVMTPATKSIYVPRDAALRVLAERLATSTQNAASSDQKEREQADIIRILSLLIE
ncbi:MAG TPA: NlpC/P60 family protein [Candidatus Angelobacter sp.]|nr:NlpC/P60 family protein [Candidatus Angelobacter sp.]